MPGWPDLLAEDNSKLELVPGQVQVWRISVSALQAGLREFSKILAPDECERAGRFRFERDRACYVVSRGLLRCLLARYTGTPAGKISFRYGPQGKPSMAGSRGRGVQFNLSHSGNSVLLAFALDHAIGVDVEHMKEEMDFAGLAKTSFSPRELDAVLALPPERRASLFYEYWTCKEACIKADGRGLSVPLDQFSIVASNKGPQWREAITEKNDVFHSPLSIHILETFPGYAAAIAAAGNSWEAVKLDLRIPGRTQTNP